MTYLTQWLEYCFHTAGVIGSNPIVGIVGKVLVELIRYLNQWYLISFSTRHFFIVIFHLVSSFWLHQFGMRSY